ncbi:Fic family protein [Microbulbifer taiwanensis]|uniref:Fic family protein n=1 Tax=Microbulbifer taiwanensis TaxID=986746 RepID=UPI00366D76CB
MEGAATTRKDAVDMLRSGRAPKDKSEQMILNNFLAMKEILALKDQPISPEIICTLHRIVTEKTLEQETSAGQIQQPEDTRVAVWDESDDQILHRPPSAEELPSRMRAMCDFANGAQDTQQYLHPVIRAIILHFWLAYDHPFEDGNGRTARALFYWTMLREGYWLFEFISISSLLKEAPSKYARSFLYTESDDNDLTYFIIFQLDIILRAITALENYIEKKTQEQSQIDIYLKNSLLLNHRQKALLANALKKPTTVYSIESHQRSHKIAYATSRADLLKLHELQLLDQFKIGKALRFRPAKNLEQKLKSID